MATLGGTLADRGLRYEVVIVGGAAMLLNQASVRPTQDVDVIAVIRWYRDRFEGRGTRDSKTRCVGCGGTWMRETVDRLDDAMLDLAWSLWSALGVSSWAAPASGWVIEIEPLLVFTALVGQADERLRREVASWAAAQESLLSVRQFKHVVSAHRWPVEDPIGDFGSLLSAATGRRWPGATETAPDVATSDRPSEVDLTGPYALQLRCRATFGVSARAEILRVLLLHDRPLTVSELAQRVAYTRRQVSGDVDLLVAAGVLQPAATPGPLQVRLARREGLLGVVGPVADDLDWAPTFSLLTGLRWLAHDLTARTWSEPLVEVARQMRALEPERERSGWNLPPVGDAPVQEIAESAMRIVAAVAP